MKYNDSIQRFRYLRAMANEGMLVCPCCGNDRVYDAWEAAGCRFRSYPNEEGVECICNRISRQTFWIPFLLILRRPVTLLFRQYEYHCRKCDATWSSRPFPGSCDVVEELDRYGIHLSDDIGYSENGPQTFATLDIKDPIEPPIIEYVGG